MYTTLMLAPEFFNLNGFLIREEQPDHNPAGT